MLSVSEYLIVVYVLLDELLSAYLNSSRHLRRLRRRGKPPQLSDAEVLCMEVVGSFLGFSEDKAIWTYFHRHWRHFFPKLPSRSQFVRQAANLWRIKQVLQRTLAEKLGAFSARTHIIDGFPVRVCRLSRAGRCRSFAGLATKSYCASQKEYFYGFEGHLLITDEGIITGATMTAANADEREAAWETIAGIEGILLGDKGYISELFWEDLKMDGLVLKTPMRKNMAPRPFATVTPDQFHTRRLVETVIGQLHGRFNAGIVNTRDTWHLTSRFARVLLSHTVACFTNIINGRSPLHFEGLVA